MRLSCPCCPCSCRLTPSCRLLALLLLFSLALCAVSCTLTAHPKRGAPPASRLSNVRDQPQSSQQQTSPPASSRFTAHLQPYPGPSYPPPPVLGAPYPMNGHPYHSSPSPFHQQPGSGPVNGQSGPGIPPGHAPQYPHAVHYPPYAAHGYPSYPQYPPTGMMMYGAPGPSQAEQQRSAEVQSPAASASTTTGKRKSEHVDCSIHSTRDLTAHTQILQATALDLEAVKAQAPVKRHRRNERRRRGRVIAVAVVRYGAFLCSFPIASVGIPFRTVVVWRILLWNPLIISWKTCCRCDVLPDSDPPKCQHCNQYGFECTFFLPITETRFKKKKLEEEAAAAAEKEKENERGTSSPQVDPKPGDPRVLGALIWAPRIPSVEWFFMQDLLLHCTCFTHQR